MRRRLLSILILAFAISTSAFDHTHRAWSSWLSTHVVEIPGPASQVDYAKARKHPEPLDAYLNTLSQVMASQFRTWSQSEQMAFFINAYNAFTIRLILNHEPVESIKKIGGLLSTPWKVRFAPLLGKVWTLDEIEHEHLRPVFKDPRIHFAVVCASIGCPRLQPTAFSAADLEEQLQRATREFLADGSRNRVRLQDGKTVLEISRIFRWYADDFGGESALAAYIIPYSPLSDDDKIKALRQPVRISYRNYDWKLNGK